jgi:glycosyltransferase involved in cell wall biosynthesis
VSEKSVLIITYYWPPSGGSGVQRWLKFVKYLPSFGYTPYVFTPENPSYDVKDESLLKDIPPGAEVIHFPIWEPYRLFSKASNAVGQTPDSNAGFISYGKQTFFQRVSIWLRANILVPDPRVFWVRPSVSFLEQFIRDKGIRIVITTGPPHSVHLIGHGLKKRNPTIKWVADFRDPWSTWGFLDSLRVSKPARFLHRFLEKKVLAKADRIVTITPFYAREFRDLSGRNVDLITNGFDEDDFKSLSIRPTVNFIVRHVGLVNEKCDPRPFLMAVKEQMRRDHEFRSALKIDFTGNIHPEFRAFVSSDAELARVVTFTPPVPHKKLMEFYENSSLLLLILTGYKDAEGYMPGKLFEYMATGLPVLGVGPVDGDAGTVIRSSGAGTMVASENEAKIITALENFFLEWKRKKTPDTNDSIGNFSRRVLTGKLVELLDAIR